MALASRFFARTKNIDAVRISFGFAVLAHRYLFGVFLLAGGPRLAFRAVCPVRRSEGDGQVLRCASQRRADSFQSRKSGDESDFFVWLRRVVARGGWTNLEQLIPLALAKDRAWGPGDDMDDRGGSCRGLAARWSCRGTSAWLGMR